MARTVSIGAQGFEGIRANGYFYVDKTAFVREWWEAGDQVTLIGRPRRFGKTLNLDTVRCFLSTDYAGRGEELFGGLDVWADTGMRTLQGTVPVVFASFAGVKGRDLALSVAGMKRVLANTCRAHDYLLASDRVSDVDKGQLRRVSPGMDDEVAATCLNLLCGMLRAHHGVAPVVLLDEYDAPMQEAWLAGFWDGAAAFQRSLFNATFKTNPALGRAIMTGVTRVSRESVFSDLNNLEVVTTLTPKYATSFGFTEGEVAAALAEFGREDDMDAVRRWYDGFTFGGTAHIYNPWSVTKFLDDGRLIPWWANTSGNGLAGEVVRHGGASLKRDFETLLQGGSVKKALDEQIVFSELAVRPDAVWALLLAAGYVRADDARVNADGAIEATFALTNREVLVTFDRMVESWFAEAGDDYGDFCNAVLAGDVEGMTDLLGDITLACMSSFDGARHPAEREPERFYHGLVLGLLVRLRGRYAVESNRESGRGRYDVMLVPNDGAAGTDPAVIIEFKVFDPGRESTLRDTLARAREQIASRGYAASLIERGIAPARVRAYGIAFRGKEVLVG